MKQWLNGESVEDRCIALTIGMAYDRQPGVLIGGDIKKGQPVRLPFHFL